MRTAARPSFDQVNALPCITEGSVQPESTDGNGHMNVRHIYSLAVTAADLLSEHLGIDDDYRNVRRMGTFAAEHHIGFFAELREKDTVSTHPLWLDRSERAGHLVVLVLNRTTRQLAATLELIVVNMDLAGRSSSPFPPDVAAQIDQAVATAQAISWPLPTSGAMSVRR